MKKNIMGALCALALLFGLVAPVAAQGSLPVALQQISDQNGHPIVGALLYFYQVGTVATRQDSFQDTGLSNANQWPLPTDAFGRVPMFYVASGSIHVRLTDPNGGPIFDYPNILVIGPSGGGGGGSSIDPTTIASTGDVKFRLTGESLTGWIKINGQSIGSAVSGATGRANADAQALYVYLWTNCTDNRCTVSGGRGASGLADFNANKPMLTPDCRGRICGVGLDDMGNSPVGRIFNSNITSGGGETVTTPMASGGEAVHTITQAQLPAVAPTFAGNAVTPAFTGNAVTPTFAGNPATSTFTGTPTAYNSTNSAITSAPSGSVRNDVANIGVILNTATTGTISTIVTPVGTVSTSTPTGTVSTVTPSGTIGAITPSGTISALGSGASMNVMTNFALGTFYMKL